MARPVRTHADFFGSSGNTPTKSAAPAPASSGIRTFNGYGASRPVSSTATLAAAKAPIVGSPKVAAQPKALIPAGAAASPKAAAQPKALIPAAATAAAASPVAAAAPKAPVSTLATATAVMQLQTQVSEQKAEIARMRTALERGPSLHAQ